MRKPFNTILFLLLQFIAFTSFAQEGFLHADGKNIVNGAGENVILRGIGTGNWMLMEGYMMKTSGFAGTQHEFRAKLEAIIGKAKTEEFFDAWLNNHFTRTDVDSMKAWGFNSVRVAMHYKWFTPPIEDEPVAGEITWIDKGFVLMDSLLDWCSDNEMYLILDLHGAPGGQGANADISDYDPSKPSLWQSQANKDKTVALWRKLAERYSAEPWIGGYDLINETNWTFPEGNNAQMRKLYGEITDAIREVDNNHIIYIEGNSFANDFSGLTPPWDDNMVYSFHKYWSGTTSGDLDWVVKDIRDKYNVPIWLGESGENSNVWYTELITSCEANNIGWSWWPVKKNGLNNILFVKMDDDYDDLINRNMSSTYDTDKAFNAVMQWAENHKIENCEVKYDVIDAMIRQPQSNEVMPFKNHNCLDTIFFSDYDLGKLGYAYSDNDFGNYGGDFVAWNTGWSYRSDGVDIESCDDVITNGYSVGWTNDDEWLLYTIEIDSTAAYSFDIRYAANSSNGRFHLELNGMNVSKIESIATTSGWYNWKTYTVEDVILEKGTHQLKFYIDRSGFNMNYFKFYNPHAISGVAAEIIHLKTDETGQQIELISNVGFNTDELPAIDEFELKVNSGIVAIENIRYDSTDSRKVILDISVELIRADQVYLSYSGIGMKSPTDETYPAFSNQKVNNQAPIFVVLPTKIQAEDYIFNNGFSLEDCTDTGGGKNLAFANPGDYTDYQVYLYEAGEYQFDYRVASSNSGRFKMQLITSEGTTDLHTITASTGGWQTWKTQSASAGLPQGKMTLRIYVLSGEFNLNWFQVAIPTGIGWKELKSNEMVFTHEAGLNSLTLHNKQNLTGRSTIEIYDLVGRRKANRELFLTGNTLQVIDEINLKAGWYIMKFENSEKQLIQKIWMQ